MALPMSAPSPGKSEMVARDFQSHVTVSAGTNVAVLPSPLPLFIQSRCPTSKKLLRPLAGRAPGTCAARLLWQARPLQTEAGKARMCNSISPLIPEQEWWLQGHPVRLPEKKRNRGPGNRTLPKQVKASARAKGEPFEDKLAIHALASVGVPVRKPTARGVRLPWGWEKPPGSVTLLFQGLDALDEVWPASCGPSNVAVLHSEPRLQWQTLRQDAVDATQQCQNRLLLALRKRTGTDLPNQQGHSGLNGNP